MLLLLLIKWLHLSLASALIEQPLLGWHDSASYNIMQNPKQGAPLGRNQLLKYK